MGFHREKHFPQRYEYLIRLENVLKTGQRIIKELGLKMDG